MNLPALNQLWQKKSWWWLVGGLATVALALAIVGVCQHSQIFAEPVTKIEVRTTYRDLLIPDLHDGTPIINASAPATLNLGATAALAFDLTDKTILFEKNGTDILYPASTTKMVTALVTLDVYQLDDTITITAEDLVYGNVVGFQVGETLTIFDALKALLITSSNEVAIALANHSPGGYDDFVNKMNQKVAALGLTSHFANPEGFDDPGQQVSAYDLAIIAQELLRQPILAEIVATANTTIVSQDGAHTHQLSNTNQLLHTQLSSAVDLPYSVFGVKTGTTNLAQEALVTGLNIHRQPGQADKPILIVVLGSKNRYNDTQLIADYIIKNVSWQTSAYK